MMLLRSGLFLLLLTVFQVSARNIEQNGTDFIENVNESESSAISTSSSSRIVSGWEARPGQHPHHAALRFVNSVGDMRQCGGSIVSKEWVITAAFCTISRILAIVRAGGVTLTKPEYIFESTEWYNHPKYNNVTNGPQQNDISLLKLQRPVVYTMFVKPIRVQPSADAYRNYDGEQVYASGHGRTETTGPTSDVLRWVYLRAMSNVACQKVYNTLIGDTSICAQFFNVTSQSTCFEDNGGPLVHVGSDGIPTLIGVSNFFPSATYGCDDGRPTGYTRPGPYLPWFQEVTGIDFENLEDDEYVNVTTTTEPTSSTTTDSGVQDENTTPSPEDSEDSEENEEESDDLGQLLKRLVVNVKVKVAFNKYNVTNVGKEISI